MNIKVYQRGDVILDTYLVEDIRSGAMGYVYVAEHKKWKIKVGVMLRRTTTNIHLPM